MYFFLLASNITDDEFNYIREIFVWLKKKNISLDDARRTFYLIEKGNKNGFIKSSFFEFLSFLEYCELNNVNLEEVVVIKNFDTIVNDKAQLILFTDDGKFNLTKKDYVISLRTYFNNNLYEFFSKFTNIIVPDKESCKWFCKLAVLSSFYNKDLWLVSKIYGSTSVLFLTSMKFAYEIIKYLKWKYNKLVIKLQYSEMWKGVFTFDTTSSNFNIKFLDFLKAHLFKPLIVTPYYTIAKEYRVYYTYVDNVIAIYSVKIKNNKNIDEAFDKGKLELYSFLDVKWEYMDKKDL